MVSGAWIIFNGNHPVQHQPPANDLPRADVDKIGKAMQALLNKKVIISCAKTPIEFVSPIFITPKKDGDVRLINLKKLNECVENFHFKMDSIHMALKLITKDCWMASLDLKDAYCSVPIHPESQNCFKV